jgi:hypothetical protein
VNFITGAGGFLQTMIAGYPGVRIDETTSSLKVQPNCIEGVEYLKLRNLNYMQHKLDLEYWCDGEVLPSKVIVTVKDTNKSSLKLTVLEQGKVKKGYPTVLVAGTPNTIESKGIRLSLYVRQI